MKTKSKNSKKKRAPSKKSSLLSLIMKNRMIIVVVGVALLGSIAYSAFAETKTVKLKAATYNVLGQQWDGATSYENWNQRKSRVKGVIESANPDIIGMQEVAARDPNNGNRLGQRDDVKDFMQKLGYNGEFGEIKNTDPIFWKADSFSVLARKERLIVEGHPGKHQPAPRFLTYVRLSSTSGKQFSVFNYHYNQTWSPNEQPERLKAAINDMAVKGDIIIFSGDFNGYQKTVVKKADRLKILDKAKGIDHIISQDTTVSTRWSRLKQTKPPASDHQLVTATITVK